MNQTGSVPALSAFLKRRICPRADTGQTVDGTSEEVACPNTGSAVPFCDSLRRKLTHRRRAARGQMVWGVSGMGVGADVVSCEDLRRLKHRPRAARGQTVSGVSGNCAGREVVSCKDPAFDSCVLSILEMILIRWRPRPQGIYLHSQSIQLISRTSEQLLTHQILYSSHARK